jgi:hypothetical protein
MDIERILTYIKTYFKISDVYNLGAYKRIVKFISLFTVVVIFIIIKSNIFVSSPKPIMTNVTIPTNKTSSTMFHPNIAVIVDFRTVDHIVAIIHNVNDHIPSTWPIQIFHGKDNQDFIKNSTLAPLISSGKILLSLMEEVYGKSRANELLTNPKFWQRVRGEKILFFQID